MIKVVVQYDREGCPEGFSCRGHAGYASRGQEDIVCAAVTCLATTLISALTDLLEIKDLTFDLAEGHISCDLGPAAVKEAGDSARLELLFRTFELGCRQIAYSYGDQYVEVIEA